MKSNRMIFTLIFALVIVSYFSMNGYATEFSFFAGGELSDKATTRGFYNFPVQLDRMFIVLALLTLALAGCLMLAKKNHLLFAKTKKENSETQSEGER